MFACWLGYWLCLLWVIVVCGDCNVIVAWFVVSCGLGGDWCVCSVWLIIVVGCCCRFDVMMFGGYYFGLVCGCLLCGCFSLLRLFVLGCACLIWCCVLCYWFGLVIVCYFDCFGLVIAVAGALWLVAFCSCFPRVVSCRMGLVWCCRLIVLLL